MTEQERRAIYDRLKKEGHYSRAGRMGGRKTKRNMLAKNPNYFSDIGKLGGDTMLERGGKEYYSKIGSISPGRKADKHVS